MVIGSCVAEMLSWKRPFFEHPDERSFGKGLSVDVKPGNGSGQISVLTMVSGSLPIIYSADWSGVLTRLFLEPE